ncbi:MAG: hypothetical protein IPI44_22630 [Sulfuritalea sp.]|nr:hypothetical protein [Sulfuritalea sp.]
MTDEIMMEVHAIKDAIGAKYGNNLDRLFKDIQLGRQDTRAGPASRFWFTPVSQQICPTLHCSGLRFDRR